MRTRRALEVVCAVVLALGLARPAAAQLGARTADEWLKTLESPARLANLKIGETMAALKVKPGDIVADVGAGAGVFTMQFAQAVKPAGKAYAVEVDQALLNHIAEKATETGATNYVETVYGEFNDPLLPVPVDLAFIHDVLHHIEDRAGYVKALARYMKPDGRIALIDFHPERGGHRNDPTQQVARSQADALLAGVGFKPIEEVALFEDKYFVIYGRR